MITLESLFATRENLRFAAVALMAHKLRSALTIIGIVIGVTTVIAMVSIIEGFNNSVVESFKSFGATLVQFQKYDVQFGPGDRDPNERQRLAVPLLRSARRRRRIRPGRGDRRHVADRLAALALDDRNVGRVAVRDPIGEHLGRFGTQGHQDVCGLGPVRLGTIGS